MGVGCSHEIGTTGGWEGCSTWRVGHDMEVKCYSVVTWRDKIQSPIHVTKLPPVSKAGQHYWRLQTGTWSTLLYQVLSGYLAWLRNPCLAEMQELKHKSWLEQNRMLWQGCQAVTALRNATVQVASPLCSPREQFPCHELEYKISYEAMLACWAGSCWILASLPVSPFF